MAIEHLRDLTPDPANARRHNPRNVGLIEDALREVGAARSIVIDETGTVLAGNATIEAAAAAGIERVQVIDADGETIIAVRRTGLTDAQKTRLALFDNRTAELADWNSDTLSALLDADAKVLAGLFTTDEIDDLLDSVTGAEPAADPGADLDRADELREKWKTERGQLWQIGRHRLLCGDSTNADDVARLMDGERPTLLITDPPYGVNYDPNWRNEVAELGLLPRANRRIGLVANDTRHDWHEAWRLFAGAVIYCWHDALRSDIVRQGIEAAGFQMRSHIIWAKPHYPISRGHYAWRHEPCWYAVKKDENADWVGGHAQTTLWEIALDQNVEGGHGTQKPVECMARPIRNHQGDVYDPFLGSGTTLVAAEQLGRRCYGMEIEPKYVAVTLERLAGMGLDPVLAEVTQIPQIR